MPLYELSLDAFVSWLCMHESEPVGLASSCYHSPLALWLSECFDAVYGVDSCRYGRALYACCSWRPLPAWAARFASLLDGFGLRTVTGLEALELLARVELALYAWVA